MFCPIGLKKENFSPAWHRRYLTDGSVYYTPERHSRRKVILAGPGDRDPLPVELALALEAHPEAELERGAKLLIEQSAESTEEQAVELPNGVYSYERGDHAVPSRLEPMELRKDSYHRLPGVYDQLIEDIGSFLHGENVYRKFGIQHRRGILLYGPPGNGKTSLIREVLRGLGSNDVVVIFMDLIPSRRFVKVMQATLSSRLKIIIFEELAATLKSSNLDHALAFLDGEISLDHCLILATTNYPERLPGNIVDRPSRFDTLYRISDPNEACRKLFLARYLEREIGASDLEATRGLSTAGLREACLLVRLKDISLSDASRKLRRHKELVKKEFGGIKEIGFSAKNYLEDDDD